MGYILCWLWNIQTGALLAKAPSSLRVCTGWSKPSLIKYDQIKKSTFTDEVKACHRHIKVSLINQIWIEADWLVCVFDTLVSIVSIPLMTHRLKIIRWHTLIRDNKFPITLNGWSVPFLNAISRPVPPCVLVQGWRNIKSYIYIYFFFRKHCILLSRFILVMLITFMRYTPLKHFSWTPAPSSLHQTNYKQIVYSSVDPDQMAFGIQKEINLGCTRLNCYHYYWSVFIVKIKLLSYNNAWNILMK